MLPQADSDHLGPTIVNLHAHPELLPGSMLSRGAERVSFTIRRVERVVKALVKQGGL